MRTFVSLVLAFAAGSVPFSQLTARRVAGVDLRDHGTGTVSGTGLYDVAGFGPLAAAGVLDVAKGAVGPLLVRGRPGATALAAAAAVAGHNWSPWLRGAGGRGISPAVGALTVAAWPGAVLLLAGLGLGRLAGETGLGSFVSQAAVPPTVAATHGRPGARVGLAVVAVLWAKRLAGNVLPDHPTAQVWANRLLYDADERAGDRR